MKKLQVLSMVLCLIALTSLNCSDNVFVVDPPNGDVRNTDSTARTPFEFTIDVTGQTKLRLDSINGNVEIRGSSNSNSVVVTGERRVESESASDAAEYLEKLEVRVTEGSHEIEVRTVQPDNNHGRNLVVDYTITMPSRLEVVARNVNGNISVEAIENDVRVTNVNGIIDLAGIIGSAEVDLVNGQISAEVSLPAGGEIDMETVTGQIQLDIPSTTSADFSARLTNGVISVTNLEVQNDVQELRSRRGRLGNGDGNISLSTFLGNISIRGF